MNDTNTVLQYGLTTFNEDISTTLYLIEPRKKFLDEIAKRGKKKLQLIKKLITKGFTETCIYSDVNSPEQTTQTKHYTKQLYTQHYRERMYTTTLSEIIKSYNIHHINKFVWNLYIDNHADVISSLVAYNNVISEIWVHKSIFASDKNAFKQLDQYYNVKEQNIIDQDYCIYQHKYSEKKQEICMYITSPIPKHCQQSFELLKRQLKYVTVVEYYAKGSIYLNLRDILHHFFEMESDRDIRNDIIVIFNPDYLANNDTFCVPYIDNSSVSIFINNTYDMMYASKACMFMLYQRITSDSFIEYEKILKNKKESTWKIFYKKHFINCIEKDFSIKEFL